MIISQPDTTGHFGPYGGRFVPEVLMAPLGRLGQRVAVTAWTHLMVCQKVDTKALDTFKKKYRYKGPEALPKEALEPGQ